MIKKRKKILVIDDSETVRAQLGQMLRDAGYEVLEAADGLLGAFAIRERAGDIALVICDINMPRFDGLEMLEILHGQLATLPVLMLTSESRIDKIINMPRFDGLEMLEILHGQLATLPVLMLTSESRIDKIDRAKRAGATAWILKPFKPKALLEAVARLTA